MALVKVLLINCMECDFYFSSFKSLGIWRFIDVFMSVDMIRD